MVNKYSRYKARDLPAQFPQAEYLDGAATSQIQWTIKDLCKYDWPKDEDFAKMLVDMQHRFSVMRGAYLGWRLIGRRDLSDDPDADAWRELFLTEGVNIFWINRLNRMLRMKQRGKVATILNALYKHELDLPALVSWCNKNLAKPTTTLVDPHR